MVCEVNGICTQFIELEPSVYKGDSKGLSERVSAQEKLSPKTKICDGPDT